VIISVTVVVGCAGCAGMCTCIMVFVSADATHQGAVASLPVVAKLLSFGVLVCQVWKTILLFSSVNQQLLLHVSGIFLSKLYLSLQ
jgi:hypothetical protein